ncbi:hypothetical protein NHX12_013202 [Muraenolepis orangiensis]|uniref:Uncharacterized protein n=1 Tax=Muraenolepis orangiensis TaxID=630683 RepID=A0A9Q0I673_9TELE|nr:hypothetical protein NHX12_013202 [Muraenolepis orangiensis]
MASSDSDEEYCQVEKPITPWDELSIVERVGLNTTHMSEEEVESAFCQITLAFRTDQYTLKQRLQTEEHARNLAEENVQQELSRGRETLKTLKGLCLDIRRSAILQRLELSLDILGGTVERISNTAELLGSVHQEARICRAVEIMATHVENLKRRRDKEGLELEQTKKLYHGRRRVSASVITKESQEKRKLELKKQASLGDVRCSSPTFSSDSFPLDTLRQRHRGKAALSKRKADRDKKGRFRSSLSSRSATLRHFPLPGWLAGPCWAVLYVALLLILCAAILTLFS